MIQVRIAGLTDICKISSVLAASWKVAYRGIVDDDYLNKLDDNHWVDFLTSALSGENIFSMVMESEHEIIGASILGATENDCEASLISFYLLPGKMGQGFGHIFYSEIENELRNRGFSSCIIDVLKDNKRAICFYETHGFTDTGRIADAVLDGRNYCCKVLSKTFSCRNKQS